MKFCGNIISGYSNQTHGYADGAGDSDGMGFSEGDGAGFHGNEWFYGEAVGQGAARSPIHGEWFGDLDGNLKAGWHSEDGNSWTIDTFEHPITEDKPVAITDYVWYFSEGKVYGSLSHRSPFGVFYTKEEAEVALAVWILRW